jgi:hypothetical protein
VKDRERYKYPTRAPLVEVPGTTIPSQLSPRQEAAGGTCNLRLGLVPPLYLGKQK